MTRDDELEHLLKVDMLLHGTAIMRMLPDGSQERIDPRDFYVSDPEHRKMMERASKGYISRRSAFKMNDNRGKDRG